MIKSNKFKYLISSIQKRVLSIGHECPSCGSDSSLLIERKFYVTELRQCNNCKLRFRTPTISDQESIKFYQSDYTEGYTTNLPNDSELQKLLLSNFVGTERDYSRYIDILDNLGLSKDANILEYGCSWGYGAWQLEKAGYKVKAFEISQPRCHFAVQKLGVSATDNLNDIENESFDVIISSHVIEHLPSVSVFLGFATKHLRDGGFLIIVCPNGSEEFRNKEPKAYSQLWGLYHPQLPDAEFFINYFNSSHLLLTSNVSNSSHLIRGWDGKELLKDDVSGYEILCVYKKI
jgi:2-polyprenyl-3-methyl-5-hydroxy-6-metoxy-1,4-benzoquinol methylase